MSIGKDLLVGFVGSAVSFILAYLAYKVSEFKYKGWQAVIKNGSESLCTRNVGVRKAKELLDDETSLSVYIKGLCSPFGWLNADVVAEESRKSGLFGEDTKGKTWTVDLAKNPPKKKS